MNPTGMNPAGEHQPNQRNKIKPFFMNTAEIIKVTKGRHAGQWRFVLKSKNGQIVAQSHPETYTTIQMCKKTLGNLFPNFSITIKIPKK